MMPVVRLNDATFVDLKSISTWIGTKTPSETIVQLVQEKMEDLDLERDVEPVSSSQNGSEDRLTFDRAPGLSFTKVLEASVDGNVLRKPNWANILIVTIAALRSKGFTSQHLVNELQVPAKSFSHDEEGFRFYPDLEISVQGQSAQDAWREVSRIAEKHQIPIEVEFQWRKNQKAQHPGRIGWLHAGK